MFGLGQKEEIESWMKSNFDFNVINLIEFKKKA